MLNSIWISNKQSYICSTCYFHQYFFVFNNSIPWYTRYGRFFRPDLSNFTCYVSITNVKSNILCITYHRIDVFGPIISNNYVMLMILFRKSKQIWNVFKDCRLKNITIHTFHNHSHRSVWIRLNAQSNSQSENRIHLI